MGKAPEPSLQLVPPEQTRRAPGAAIAAKLLNQAAEIVRALHNAFIVPDSFLPDHPDRELMVNYLKDRAWRGTDAGAASAWKIPLSKLDEWRQIPEFTEMEKRADEAATDLVEEQALFAAYTGDKEMMKYVLKSRRPDKYSDRQEVTGKGGGPVEFKIVLGDIPRPKRVE